MSTKRMGLRGTSSAVWWLRLTVAVWVLSAWVVVGFAGGIAHADDTSSPAGDSTSAGPPASKDSKTDPDADPNRKPEAEKPDRPAPESPTDENTATAEDTDTDPPTGAVEPPTADPAPDATADPPDPAPEVTEDTKDPAPDSRRSSLHHDVTNSSPTPTKPIAAEPRTPAGDATSPRSSAPIEQPQAQTSSRTQQALTVAPPIGPSASIIQPGTDTQNLPQLGRQVVGLVSDVGTVVMSAVYTVADTVAKAFGPDSFFGVPYALATAVANSAAAVSRTLIGAPDYVGTGRFPVNYGIINGLTFFNPQGAPPGANDPRITVTDEHPLPIILLNGTVATQGENWGVGAPVLANAGYKVYSFNYGNVTGDPNFPIQATDDIRESARQLAAEVDRVLLETGAPKVILIGHSQGGGILPAYYINNMNGADKVSQLIGIAPSNHGTDFNGLIGLQNLPILGPLVLGVVNAFGEALLQQSLGSEFQREVYGNGDTRPGVLYTMIASTHDEVVTPYTQQALNGPNVTNIVIQDLYPGLPVGHLGVVLSPQVWSVVLDALASNPAANPLADPQQSVALVA